MKRGLSLMLILLLITVCMVVVGCGHGFGYLTGVGTYSYKEEPISFKSALDGGFKVGLDCSGAVTTPINTYFCALVAEDALVKNADVTDLKWSIDGKEFDNIIELIALEAVEWGDDDLEEHQVAVEFTYEGEKKKYSKKITKDS